MQHCRYCGAELPSEDARFCGNCGRSISTSTLANAPMTPSTNDSRPLADAPTMRATPSQPAPAPMPQDTNIATDGFSFQEYQTPLKEDPGQQVAPERANYQAGEHFGVSAVEQPSSSRPLPSGTVPPPVPQSGYPAAPAAPPTPPFPPQAVPAQPGIYPPPVTPSQASGLYQSVPAQPGAYPPPIAPAQSGAYPQAVPVQPGGYPPQTPPAFPGGYPQGGPYQPPQRKPWLSSTAGKVTLAIIIIAVILGGAGSILIYQMTRPKPIITVSSDYKVGNEPAGASTTILRVTGQQFSGSSTITFLLDNKPLASQSMAISDQDGKFNSNLKIDEGWSIGKHTLTAKDAGGYTTQTGISVNIVTPGQAKTPGPKDAPSDDQSFNLEVLLTGRDTVSGNPYTAKMTLIVTGHPDPTGGSVCTQYADGTPHTNSGISNGATIKETATTQCQGTYKGGKIDYNEKLLQDTLEITQQGQTFKCTLNTTNTQFHIEGSFESKSTASGSFDSGTQSYSCNIPGTSSLQSHDTGTWTGFKAS
ncbi:zinc ribbon domain-containing protein [Ktedonospora formicarum]|uniref:Zinc-ribbon domain-containing protein n=1 Tax=Ktedonospora formicarum TaxID=2778364 RepID=A0A8J3MSQ5_9CHLR|nr:zinc ribbon domain-containing protein [Ktedonospora formicarum]GHO43580.1 hypothetical protein KSX_17430 [Ktedonospora formicarum]